MKRIIAGGTGLIGKHLVMHWKPDHDLVIIGRDKEKIKKIHPDCKPITWDELEQQFETLITDCDVIVNLAGANIGAERWNTSRKKIILESRTQTTAKIASLCGQLGSNAPTLLNASAVGIYGLQIPEENKLPEKLTEDSKINFNEAPDFLAKVGRHWEKATEYAKENDARVINARFGIVLAKDGGVLAKLALPFYFGLGGKIGSGNQPISWIHLEDLLQAFDFVIEHKQIHGPVNFTSPNAVLQIAFAKTLASILKRPAIIPTPAFILKLVFGQMAEELLLKGQHVYPKKLLAAGFEFRYPTLESALRQIYGSLK